MQLDPDALLQPLSEEAPCGPDLRGHADFEVLLQAVAEVDRTGASERMDWASEQARILHLAGTGRDLRVWVWLCRSLLASDGLSGLACGLELIATGLERFWDTLPPFDAEETDPRERFMGRLGALAGLGASSYQLNADELLRRRSTLHLAEELDRLAGAVPPNEETAALASRAEATLARIARLFEERFGAAHDPQLGFTLLAGKLAPLRSVPAPAESGAAPATTPVPVAVAGNGAVTGGPLTSREDVVRSLNLVLDYYAKNEPSSPVPLLVARARKFVTLSFLEAIRELAPAGLKELQLAAGLAEDAKPQPKKE
jgi:type VI secretion system protein ImpA